MPMETRGTTSSSAIHPRVSKRSWRVQARTNSRYRTGALTMPGYATTDQAILVDSPAEDASSAFANNHQPTATMRKASSRAPTMWRRRQAKAATAADTAADATYEKTRRFSCTKSPKPAATSSFGSPLLYGRHCDARVDRAADAPDCVRPLAGTFGGLHAGRRSRGGGRTSIPERYL